jgi:hypothetical protein
MKSFVYLVNCCVLLVALPLFAASEGEQDFPDVTEEGLHRVPDSKMALVYADPAADLSGYARVQLLDAHVAFRKNWERDQRSRSADPLALTSNDVNRIKKNLAQEFRAVFTETLEEGGFPVVDEAADDVLLLRPAIVNLDVAAPETSRMSRGRTYVDSAGQMTLYIELYDSVTGDLIAKALDRRVDDSRSGYYTWANSVSNRAAADRILKGWAEILLDALNEAHGK